MKSLRHREFLQPARDPLFAGFLLTSALCFIPFREQPDVIVTAGTTSLTITPTDVALAILAIACAWRLTRHRDPFTDSRYVVVFAAMFSAWLLVSAVSNGSTAFVAAGKLIELGVLAVAAAVTIVGREHLRLFLTMLVAVNTAAVVWALKGFVEAPGSRQPSFTGEHDLAALSTMTLAIGLAGLFATTDRRSWLPVAGGVVGALGLTLGAALASLLGMFLAIGAIVAIAATRHSVTVRAVALTMLVAVAITAGVLTLRSDNLGFLRSWLGVNKTSSLSSENAGAWSQRLIYAYVGGRIFLSTPIAGTGWYGNLPPSEYERFLPDAHRHFPDQPPRYFPQVDGEFVPQQTYDQVLYELGLIGAVLLLGLLVATIRSAIAAGRAWPARDPDEVMAYLPAAFAASLIGVLAGSALFGGSPLAAIFWLTIGVIVATLALSMHANEPAHPMPNG